VFAPDEPALMTLAAAHAALPPQAEIARRVHPARLADGSIQFVYRGYPESHDAVAAKHLASSFVVDFDAPAVRLLHAQAEAESPERPPSVEWLRAFVDRTIDKKDMQRSFDIASYVAAHHEGDCTEHAVLLAALARSFGVAARVVIGVVVFANGGRTTAGGHAWVEFRRGTAWKVADAAVPAELAPRYIPMWVLDDESASFSRHMVEEGWWLANVARLSLERVPKK
jgi:hypothetical protein